MTIAFLILAILGFGFLIVVHEFGHFFAAKAAGVRVVEFWIGMGPALLKHKIGETEFKLCALPFGGACVMDGEDSEDERPGTLAGASIGWRALILAAGALMNFLIGFLIVLILVMPGDTVVNTSIDSFEDGFPAKGENMLMENDRIVKIDGFRILLSSDISTALSRGDGSYEIVVERDGEKLTLENVEIPVAEYNGVQRYGLNFQVVPAGFFQKIQNAAYRSFDFARMVWISLGDMISGKVHLDQMAGPVGVTGILVQTAQNSLESFFLLIAFISINLGVMNLLPLPALDGGRLLFVLIELIAGRPVPRKFEGYIHVGGMAVLMLFMLYITFQDVLRLVG